MGKSKLLDFDPEALLDPNPSSSSDENSDFESEEDVAKGREHYAHVGKSKLRKKEVVPLGPQYTGSKISRDAIEDEDSDDPFARKFDNEDSEEESDDEKVKGNGVVGSDESGEEDVFGIEHVDSDEEMGDSEEDDDSEGQKEDETEDTEDTEEDDESDDSDQEVGNQTAKLREMMKDTTLLASGLSQAAQADIEKGKAIKTQRKTFDTLLNTRIRLQKALISTNSLAAEPHNTCTTPEPAIEAAEAAALTLLNNLTNLRSTLDEARTGQKRKRPTPFTPHSTSSEILAQISIPDAPARKHQQTVLEKWSAKTRGATLNANKGRLNANASATQTLTDVLTAHLQDATRLVARTQMPRSCAPVQSAAKLASSEHIYDDADFYGQLLKQLLENRSSELDANGAGEFLFQAPWQLARSNKTKKIVDTKASKGRKLRYTVHEKLQNLMVPEDRGEWGERQIEELFGGLFGRKAGLGEEEEEEEGDVAEEGLMLFRS